MLALLVLVLLLALLLVLDQGGQVGVVGLGVVLPGLLVHVGFGDIELLAVFFGQAFRLFPVF